MATQECKEGRRNGERERETETRETERAKGRETESEASTGRVAVAYTLMRSVLPNIPYLAVIRYLIQDINSVGSCKYDHIGGRIEPIHLHEQLQHKVAAYGRNIQQCKEVAGSWTITTVSTEES